MAVQLSTENSAGVIADHWVLVAFFVHREGTTADFVVTGRYRLWLDAAAFAAGKEPLARGRASVSTGVASGNPTFGATQTALDAEIVKTGEALDGGSVV